MPFVPNEDLTMTPASSLTAPISSGSGFLSALAGGTPYGAAIGAAADVAKAALADTPTNQSGTIKDYLAFQVSSPFQVGGKGNSLSNEPTQTASPIDSTNPAQGSIAGVAGFDKNTLVLIGAAIVAAVIVLIGLRRK